MRILELRLLAFGPFTDGVIDLDGGTQGLHLIYGPNEAGKSSALRALRRLLFGIPMQDPDNFLHPYQKMRIGGVIQHSDGTVLELIRRKGRVNTLRSGDDKEILDEALLKKFLGPMEAGVFETMFGIDHTDLIRGGEEIIKGGGHVGQALFAAGSGIAHLRQVQADLNKEADELFAPTATKRTINEGFSELKKNQKALKEAELPGREWEVHHRALARATRRRAELDEALARHEQEKNRIERIHEALPLIARRKELVQAFTPYADAVLLPEDFGERRRKLLTELEVQEHSRDQSLRALEDVRQEMEPLEKTPALLLENARIIGTLVQELGSHRKAAGDRIGLSTQRDVLLSEARETLSLLRKDLTLEEAEKLRLNKAETVRIQELGGRYERLMARREGALEEISRLTALKGHFEKGLESLDSPRPVDDLVAAVERAQDYGPVEVQCQSEFSEIQATRERLKRNLSRQTLWTGTLEGLEGLNMPSLETIDRFEKDLTEAEAEVTRLKSAKSDTEEDLLTLRGDMESLSLEQEVPTEKDLQEARGVRESGPGPWPRPMS